MQSKITILYIIDIFNAMGGAEKNLWQVVTKLNYQRYKPIVCCLRSTEFMRHLLKEKDIEVLDLNLRSPFTISSLPRFLSENLANPNA